MVARDFYAQRKSSSETWEVADFHYKGSVRYFKMTKCVKSVPASLISAQDNTGRNGNTGTSCIYSDN